MGGINEKVFFRRISISSDASSAFENKAQPEHSDSGSENDQKDSKLQELLPIKKRRSSENSEVETKVSPLPTANDGHRKTAFRMQLAQQIASNSTKVQFLTKFLKKLYIFYLILQVLKKPIVVVRPAPLMLNPIVPTNHLVLDKRVILCIFKYLTPQELLNCALGKLQ